MTGLYEKVWCVSKYFECDDFRIFSMTNIPENRLLLEKIKLRANDRIVVLLTWMHSIHWFMEAKNILLNLGFNLDQFYIMANTQLQLDTAVLSGFKNSYLINRHFVMQLGLYRIDTTVQKIYDACIFGEQVDRNRMDLVFHLPNLAIIDPVNDPHPTWNYPKGAWKNNEYLGTDSPIIQETMRKSYTGVCFSEAESMCYSSVEFFLNGIPVVSSKNDTGRLEWYTDHNSIFIDNVEKDTITNAVKEVKQKVLDKVICPEKIRQDTIDLSKQYRRTFRTMTGDIFKEMGVDDISEPLFKFKYHHRFLYATNWKSFDEAVYLFD